MTRETLETRIAALAEPFVASLGLELWGIELAHGNRPLVRLFVDSAEGATIDQCARISRHVGVALDVEDIMQSAYVLEVSSPGLERPFFRAEQLSNYLEREIELTLVDPVQEWPGRRKFRGNLVAVEGETITLCPANQPVQEDEEPQLLKVTWEEVRKAHLIHVFPEPGHNKPTNRN